MGLQLHSDPVLFHMYPKRLRPISMLLFWAYWPVYLKKPPAGSVIKFSKQKGDSFGAALTLGAGHGGVEAVSIGFIVLINLVAMIGLRSMDMTNLPLPAEQMQQALDGMQSYFATAWHLPLAGAVERIGALALHITLSVMVWLAISFRKPLWFWGAILYHALVDGLVVLATSFNLGVWLIEIVFVAVAFAVLYFVLRFAKQKEQQGVELLDLIPPERVSE